MKTNDEEIRIRLLAKYGVAILHMRKQLVHYKMNN